MINFPFGTNGKSIILGVPILKHITVCKGEQLQQLLFVFQNSPSKMQCTLKTKNLLLKKQIFFFKP